MSDVYIADHLEQRLVAAAGSGDISTVRKLLRKKIPTTVIDEYGRTALHVASAGVCLCAFYFLFFYSSNLSTLVLVPYLNLKYEHIV